MANRRVPPLTDTLIKRSTAKEKNYILPDGNGLQLLVKTIGSKVWEVRYTLNGKPSKTTIGTYPEVTLAEARKKRDLYRKKIYNGINPIKDLYAFIRANFVFCLSFIDDTITRIIAIV